MASDEPKRYCVAPAITDFELTTDEQETARGFFELDDQALELRISELEMADQFTLAGVARVILTNRGTPNPSPLGA